MALGTQIQSKVTVYTVRVSYSTVHTLLDPCAFLQSSLADSVVKDIGLGSGTVTSCLLLGVTSVSNKNLYMWDVEVSA